MIRRGGGPFFSLPACLRKNAFVGPKCIFRLQNASFCEWCFNQIGNTENISRRCTRAQLAEMCSFLRTRGIHMWWFWSTGRNRKQRSSESIMLQADHSAPLMTRCWGTSVLPLSSQLYGSRGDLRAVCRVHFANFRKFSAGSFSAVSKRNLAGEVSLRMLAENKKNTKEKH